MKKSKIIVPALGIILLTTAASVTGTVAWFTANTVYTATMGEFAVVNTKNNLSCTLGNGVGTVADNENKKVDVSSGYKLTDASLDHTATSIDIVEPDEAGTKVGAVKSLASYVASPTTRATNTYSAFTWTMSFKMSFSGTAEKKMGLFLDLSHSWTHEVVNITAADLTKAGGTISKTGYYTDAACTTAVAADITAAGKFYRQAPDTTGKGFRIALIPTTIPSGSYGVSKIWAPNQDNAGSQFVDGLSVGTALAGTSYGTATTSNSGSGLAAETVGSGKVLMPTGSADAVPSADSVASSAAKSGYNSYPGYFGPVANTAVTLEFTCVAWYEGTDANIVNNESTVYETVTSCMEFDVVQLTD